MYYKTRSYVNRRSKRVKVLSFIANMFGIQFKLCGEPYGASLKRDLSRCGVDGIDFESSGCIIAQA